ncbi:ZYBA0S05-03554g1_1 [Zygosaccharomyces bailii CLIB 213]|uniref:Transcription elongation factor SPT5 n=1 Tax=Zygosaccharomyces bailii (strain CLIB 213 / ATCC 58445 / CBS 680 / BCRC 21525 / NBRC 1098 / NCYC 1416 / NRRL Y-2227) TaxID=1333698 RepID=A0A8J2XB01_ZYGB2|nr:ZYBA0S05-03554g1_1 [Zygosaccharomyces bailii CLIB 213]
MSSVEGGETNVETNAVKEEVISSETATQEGQVLTRSEDTSKAVEANNEPSNAAQARNDSSELEGDTQRNNEESQVKLPEGQETSTESQKRPREEEDNKDEKEKEDDDDEDDDDDDDDDDEEDEEGPNKKRRRERNRFLDIEAEVSDDDEEDEDEEDSELVREGFITRGDDEEEGTAGDQREDRLHRQLDQDLNKSSEEDAQRLAKELRERYGRSSSKQYRAAAQDGYVPQRLLLPSVDTATIWGVRCRPGKEKELVKKLFKKKLNLDRAMGKKKLKIMSIFQRDNYTGRIYIEAPKQSVIEKFCNGVPDIYTSQKLLIPVQELPLLLKPNKSDDVNLEEGSYVRIKRGVYKGDLAVVDQISENNLEVMLKIVPRLDYGKYDEVDPATNQKKSRRPTFAHRPPSQLFNPTMALRLDQANLYKRDDHHFVYKNEDYVDGYLYKSFKIQHVETKNIQPTVEELARFGSKDGAMDLTTISQTIKKNQAARVTFQPGDRVEVLSGEQRGSRGIVVKTAGDIATVKLPDFPLKPLEYPVSTLRKIFEAGDHVTVVNGDHQGDAGLVLLVEHGQVTFMSNQTKEEVTITANNLTKSMDSTPTSSEYALHDIVELSAKNAACIIQAGHDIFKVLDETGKVSTITKGSILGKINTARARVATVDSNGHEIKIGDTIVEKVGARREGQILYIQSQQIFVMSKKIAENAGVFVVNPMNVEAVASKDNLLNNKLDLNKINPDVFSRMGPPSKNQAAQPQFRTGRDLALGKTVRIRAAGYKGQLGIVKDVNGDNASVELHSKNKHVTIDKRKLTYYNREGGQGVNYEELVNRSGKLPQGRMGPSYVSAPRHMATGGPIAASASGPSHGGITPGWGMDGAKTPAVNSQGSGGASAWGSGSTGGGASTWGGQGGASTWGGTSTWGGQGNGATSTWGGDASAWGNKSSWGGASTWASGGESNGGASAWGGRGDRSAYGGASAWGGGAGSSGAGASGGNSSTWGNQDGSRSGYGGGSTWGGNK